MDLFKKVLFWGLAAYPITWAIEKLLQIPIFYAYKEILSAVHLFLYGWWDWLIIAGITYLLIKNIFEVKYQTMEEIRTNRLHFEIKRWVDTPYVPPILFYYLIKPPQAVSDNMKKIVDNRFYQMVVHYFRDRIYINANYQSNEPLDRPSLLRIIGMKDIAKTFFIFLAVFFWFSLVTFRGADHWLYEWERFTLPLVIYFSLYTSMKLQGYFEMTYSKMDRVLNSYLGHPEPHILWRDLFPDRERGQIILAAWAAECEKRERYRQTIYGGTGYAPQSSPLAPYPYPSYQLPDWVDDMDAHYQQKLEQWAVQESLEKNVKSTNAKVIDLSKRRKNS